MGEKYNFIFIETKFSQINILGRQAREYVQKQFSKYKSVALYCEDGVDERVVETHFQDAINIVLPLDMPLVTLSVINKAYKMMCSKKIKRMRLGMEHSIAQICIGGAQESDVWLSDDIFLRLSDAKSINMVYTLLKDRILDGLLAKGVTIPDRNTVFVDDTVEVSSSATVLPLSVITGQSKICDNATVSASQISDSIVENGANVLMSHIVQSHVCEHACVGPFARIRQAIVGKDCRVGDFVEIKASNIANGVKAAHLAYIGDAQVGENTNIGCGTVFCNYDGKTKHKINVGKDCFIGANTNLIAPLTVGDNAYIAAGTTVNKDIENGTFTIGRVRQETKRKN